MITDNLGRPAPARLQLFWILTKQEMMGWHWHQMDYMKSFAPGSRQITTPAPHHSIFTGWMLFLTPNHHHHHNRFTALFLGPPG